MLNRKGYPSDVSDEEWSFVAPYLCLMREDVPQREHSLREVYNALRYLVRAGCPWRLLPNDLPPWKVVYDQSQRWKAAGCFESMELCRGRQRAVGAGGEGEKYQEEERFHEFTSTGRHLLLTTPPR